jgi:hypothetical protein
MPESTDYYYYMRYNQWASKASEATAYMLDGQGLNLHHKIETYSVHIIVARP